MMIAILIATIIHMNMGYELPEALGRGVISAILVGAVFGIIALFISLIVNAAERR